MQLLIINVINVITYHSKKSWLLHCSDSQWRSGAAVAYTDSEMSQRSYPSDRNPGPLGDLYTSVDRTRDPRIRCSHPHLNVVVTF